ncbi:MAG: sel1 repeat family protein [Sandaracinus sp.]|nr:sel1 repeat family protein [Sandaracinus sp.]MCB9616568.1 sel1 repeat family protein [Sandaracinus sp.]MCB9622496.1 sel1 repeat family protein [Sandaracinus sp.]
MTPSLRCSLSELEASAASDPHAMLRLAWFVAHGLRGADADPARALALEARAAELGHPVAARRMGDRFTRGDGVTADDATAIVWYRRASEAGDAGAMSNLIGLLEGEERARWLVEAAELGQPHARYVLAESDDAERQTLADFAKRSLEELTALAGDEEKFDLTYETETSVDTMQAFVARWIEAIGEREPLLPEAHVDGEPLDFPGLDELPEDVLENAATIELSLEVCDLWLYLDDDVWNLQLFAVPAPDETTRRRLVEAFEGVAEELGLVLSEG